MGKLIIISNCALLLFAAGCDNMKILSGAGQGSEDSPPPSRYVNLKVVDYDPRVVWLDSVTTVSFEVEWERSPSYESWMVLDAIISSSDSCHWSDPIVVDTVRTSAGVSEFSIDLLFRSGGRDCEPYILIEMRRDEGVYGSIQLGFLIIP